MATRKFQFKNRTSKPYLNVAPQSLQDEQCEPSEQIQYIKKGVRHVHDTALDLVKSGHHLLSIAPVNKTVQDAQYLYNQQLINDYLYKAAGLSSVQVPDAYDNLNAELRDFDKQAILKEEEFRRAIISISTAWNSLGVYRADFTKNDNDKMCRHPVVAEIEKGFLDYIGSVKWDVTDRETNERSDTAYKFLRKPNPQGSFRDVMVPAIRDQFRYDAGAVVKTFNRRTELIELRPYLGTEFWIEMDRVPQLISVPTNDNIGIRATEFTSEKTPGKEVLMQGWWSRGFAWRYWQRSQTGVYIPFTPNEVCYLSMYKRSDDVYGVDYIKFLKYYIQYLIDSTVAAGKTFQNGMVPSIVFTHPNIYNINQIQSRITQLRVENVGPTRTGNAMHLINGESAQSLAQHLHDMEWVEGQKWFVQLVCGYFGFDAMEFTGGGDTTRATAYVKRNITKSRMLAPMLQYLEDKINDEILPWLPGYEDTWEFHFIRELELDDKQKVAQTGAIRMGTLSAGLQAGIPARLAYKLSKDEPLSKADIDELDTARQEMMMQQQMGGMGEGGDIMEDVGQGRYDGSGSYQPVNFSDYGQGGENTEQRFGNKEEAEYTKAIGEMRYAVDDTFYEKGKKFVITSANDKVAKARVYVDSVQDVPEGRSYKQGERGKLYYLTTLKQQTGHKKKPAAVPSTNGAGREEEEEHSAPGGDGMANSEKMVRVSGNNIGLQAGIVNGKLVAKQLKTKETAEFIKKVMDCGGSPDHPGQFLSCMKKIGKDLGLEVSA